METILEIFYAHDLLSDVEIYFTNFPLQLAYSKCNIFFLSGMTRLRSWGSEEKEVMEPQRPRPSSSGGPPRHQIAGLYDLGETIGEGHYAVVKLAKHVFTGEKVAVKVIDKLKLDAATR